MVEHYTVNVVGEGSNPFERATYRYNLMQFKVQFIVSCDWEDEKIFEGLYGDILSLEELVEQSTYVYRKALHYIYKKLESPLYMTLDISPLLHIFIYQLYGKEKVRAKYLEKEFKKLHLKNRLNNIGHWRVA